MNTLFSRPKMTSQRLVTLAMLAALAIVISKFSITVIPNQLVVGFTFIVNTIIGMVAGPIWSFITLALIDVVDNLSSGQGNFIIWWTLMEAIEGLLYGLFFHGHLLSKTKKQDWFRVTLAVLVIMLFSTFLMTPFLIQTYFGTPIIAQYLAGRWLKIFEIPVRIIAIMLLIPQLQKIPELRKLVK
ncbi:folate family ECF transporter S component [Streptococcus sp. sy018]|uniref:folate family ECF transporter S component n=1 Tax=Streptococcus sp. sy018 TaxID=2600147 RepID=UPI0011B682CF|nr:folate family ECF transporter S component [Streptococcus sp. sy018]TWS95457.1 folate family ECF transporter S component [Streptococcus sp. sy018]